MDNTTVTWVIIIVSSVATVWWLLTIVALFWTIPTIPTNIGRIIQRRIIQRRNETNKKRYADVISALEEIDATQDALHKEAEALRVTLEETKEHTTNG